MSMNTPFPNGIEPVELPSKYAKAIVAIALAVVAVFVTATTDNRLTLEEVGQIITTLLTALLVYLVPNLASGPARYLKFIVAVLGALVVTGISQFSDGHISTNDAALIVLALLNSVGVGVVPNTGYVPRHRALSA